MSCDQHLLCELVGGPCSLAAQRSRGCRPNVTSTELAPGVVDEVRALVAAIDVHVRTDEGRAAAVRLATLVRREALDGRNLVALVGAEEPELAPALQRLCLRRKPA